MLHNSKGYSWDDDFGPDGAWLRGLISWFDHKAHHSSFKTTNGRDVTGTGLGGALLLARWGDTAAAETNWISSIAHWARTSDEMKVGTLSWRTYRMDVLDARATRALLLAAERYEEVRRLFDCSPEGVAFATTVQLMAAAGETDRAAARRQEELAMSGLASHVDALCDYMNEWGMQCTWTQSSFVLMARAVGTLLLPDESLSADVDPFRWLPPPGLLLELASAERAWDVWLTGAQHPSLACAMVYARMGHWDMAREIANGLLDLLVQRLTRFEAHRLLARCASAVGDEDAAKTSLRAAAEEAASAGYLHLETLALRGLSTLGSSE